MRTGKLGDWRGGGVKAAALRWEVRQQQGGGDDSGSSPAARQRQQRQAAHQQCDGSGHGIDRAEEHRMHW